MAITAFTGWSATAALNVDLNGIPLDGATMTANQVDDAFRELMAQLATAGFSTVVAASTSAAGISEFATAAEWRVGTDAVRSLVVAQVWAAAAEVTLTDAATITVDGSTFINAVVTLGGNRTLGTWSNPKVGQSGYIRVVQDGTGSRTLAFHADYEFAGGTAIVLSTTAAAQDMLFYQVIASGRVLLSAVKAIS